ncbi:hypothetical protein [Mannheimia granulomatis]|uniref:hypothetical protein n=1 Tax=Mannheimia granulomatis TaxID=85402 RepID=UPI00047B5CAA|nr:hypothetical protein [Mannheimia granulomatis]QLB19333.1 hypothetical protein A6B41_07695 [Mannheimia granulomatis]
MKRLFRKSLIIGIAGLFMHTLAVANEEANITRYEQAKVRLSYEGSVGNLLQQLSQRLKVGFIAYDIDINRKVVIQNENETAIKMIQEQIENQLSDADIRFEKIGSRLFIVISAKGGEPLIKAPTQGEQFVGDIVFESSEEKTEIASNAPANNASSNRLQEIFNIATDKASLAAVKNKKAPQYKTVSKENLGLKNIRVTPLGTFLIFESDIEAAKFKVTGQFEEMAQGENIVAILHQNSNPPAKIEIENEQGKKLILEVHAVQSKTQKKK